MSSDLEAVALSSLAAPFVFRDRQQLVDHAAMQVAQRSIDRVMILGYFVLEPVGFLADEAINEAGDLRGRTLAYLGPLLPAASRTLGNHQINTQKIRMGDLYQPQGQELLAQSARVAVTPTLALALVDAFRDPTLSLTNHQFAGVWLGMNRKGFDALDPETQAGILAATEEVQTIAAQLYDESLEAQLSELADRNATIVSPTDLASIFTTYRPDTHNSNGCNSNEYAKLIDEVCTCVEGAEDDQCKR